MTSSVTFYTPLRTLDLQKVIEDFQTEFQQLLEDNFTDDELIKFERQIDSIAAVFVQPIFSELSFDDFNFAPNEERAQRFFFEECHSSVLLENLPYLESNPFQVTWLTELLGKFSEVLIDRGGVCELCFKEEFSCELKKYKKIDHLLNRPEDLKHLVKSVKPTDPVDFLVADVYRELSRLQGHPLPIDELGEKVIKIYEIMFSYKLDSLSILRKSGLNPKDFDDGLERLKFFLRKY
jgi:hypothetical protein